MTTNFHTMKKNNVNRKGGFTLVETLVAISILLVAVAAPVSLIGDSVHRIYYAKDEAVAVNLAQEGIEIVRQVRDTNMLNNAAGGWLTNLSNGTYTTDPGGALINSGQLQGNQSFTAMTLCGASCAPQPIYYDATTGLYRQGAGFSTRTQFSRIVTISGAAADERQVTSTVRWQTGGSTGTVSATENIFKWAL